MILRDQGVWDNEPEETSVTVEQTGTSKSETEENSTMLTELKDIATEPEEDGDESLKAKRVEKPVGPRWSFRCLLCDIKVLQLAHFVDHQKGKKHAGVVLRSGHRGVDTQDVIKGRFECFTCNVWASNYSAFLRHWESQEHKECITNIDAEAAKRNKEHSLGVDCTQVAPTPIENSHDRLKLTDEVLSIRTTQAQRIENLKDNCQEVVGYCELCDVQWLHTQQKNDHLGGRRHAKSLELKKRYHEAFMAFLNSMNINPETGLPYNEFNEFDKGYFGTGMIGRGRSMKRGAGRRGSPSGGISRGGRVRNGMIRNGTRGKKVGKRGGGRGRGQSRGRSNRGRQRGRGSGRGRGRRGRRGNTENDTRGFAPSFKVPAAAAGGWEGARASFGGEMGSRRSAHSMPSRQKNSYSFSPYGDTGVANNSFGRQNRFMQSGSQYSW